MNSTLKTKTIPIFVILTSINFIYSSNCCNSCKKNKETNEGGGKKTISKKSKASRDAGRLNIKDIKGTKNLDKRNPCEGKNKKLEEERKRLEKEQQQRLNEEKKKFEDRMTAIKSNLESFLKNSKIRKKRNYLWEVSYSNDGSVTIKYCNFTGFIAKKEIDKIEDCNAVTENYSDNIMVAVEVKTGVDIPNKHNIKDPTCTLDNLIKSLNSLGDFHRRIDGPEYLCVEKKDSSYRYIDLSNGVVYSIDDIYLCKRFKNDDTFNTIKFKDGSFYNKEFGKCIEEKKAFDIFSRAYNNKNIYTSEFANIAF